jgi:GDP-L-fucose synthase
MQTSDKIYVAGHTGMVGSAIVRTLRAAGFTNLLLQPSSALDLRNQPAVNAWFQVHKPDYVFLAAARVGGIVANNTYRAEFLYDNLMIEANVIHASYLAGVKKLLFLGSSCIYPRMAAQPMTEDALLTGALEPTNEPYAIAKIAGLKLCESYRRQYGCDFISAMPTNLYGPGDNYHLQNSHVIPGILRKMHLAKCLAEGDWTAIRKDLAKYPLTDINSADSERLIQATLEKFGIYAPDADKKQGEVVLWGSGNPLREFLHVDDLAAACVFLMQEKSQFDFVNVGSGHELTIAELAHQIRIVTEFKGEITFDHTKPDGTPRKYLDTSRLTTLGFTQTLSLENGLQTVYSEYKKYASFSKDV